MKTTVTLTVKSEGLNTKREYYAEFPGHVDVDEAVLNLSRKFEEDIDHWAKKGRRWGKDK